MTQVILAALLLPAAAMAAGAGLTAVVRRQAVRRSFVARPQADRYHRSVIALGGGAAIFWTLAIFILAGAAAVRFVVAPGYLDGWLSPSLLEHTEGFLSRMPQLMVVLGVALALHLMGLWDDMKHLGPFFKLTVQFAAAFAAVVWADVRITMFIESHVVTAILSVFWIVLIINVFNFLDNMDGLSAGIAAIATAVLMVAAMRSGQFFVAATGLVFLGALLGFLVFNFPPASIFMGDAGSMVVGFFVALLTARTTYYDPALGTPLYSVFMPAVVMAVPLYDFITVTFLRLKQGKSPFVGDTQHFSHRLKRRGLSDRHVALTLYLATLCTGLGGIILQEASLAGAVLVFVQTVLILVIVGILEASSAVNSNGSTR